MERKIMAIIMEIPKAKNHKKDRMAKKLLSI